MSEATEREARQEREPWCPLSSQQQTSGREPLSHEGGPVVVPWAPRGHPTSASPPQLGPRESAAGRRQSAADYSGCSIFAELGPDTLQQEIKLNRPFCPEALNTPPSVKHAGEGGTGSAAAEISGRGFMFWGPRGKNASSTSPKSAERMVQNLFLSGRRGWRVFTSEEK